MIRLVALAFSVLLVILLLSLILRMLRRAAPTVKREVRRRVPRRPARGYEWESRYDQTYRKVKGVPRIDEDRAGIVAFLESRRGVEAFVEPRTAVSPLSVILVAEDGEPRRFHLSDDSFLRELARTRGLLIRDAIKDGYPQRMRDYLKRQRQLGSEGDGPDPDQTPSPE